MDMKWWQVNSIVLAATLIVLGVNKVGERVVKDAVLEDDRPASNAVLIAEPAHSDFAGPDTPEPIARVPEEPVIEPPETVDIEASPELAEDYDPDIPLSAECQLALNEACDEAGIDRAVMLGLIQVESRFREDADNGVCYGLCQLNRHYFPADLSPADNVRHGVAYLANCLVRCDGDISAALTAYNAGHDTGNRAYANRVLEAAEDWR